MLPITLVTFLAAALGYPLAIVPVAIAWPWILAHRLPKETRQTFANGLTFAIAIAAGLYIRRRFLVAGADELLGSITWFIAVVVGVLGYGLSTVGVGIREQERAARRAAPRIKNSK